MTGPVDEMDASAAGRDRMRASHADREQAIEVLKAAFAQGRLDKDELDARAGQALAARTYADLAVATADIPPPAPAAAGQTRPSAPARRRPLARAAVKSGICLIITAAAIGVDGYLDPGGVDSNPPQFWVTLMGLLAIAGLWTAVGIMGYAVFTSWDERSSRRQLPPRPGSGGQALEAEQRGATGQAGHDLALPRDRPDQASADMRSDSSPPGRPHSSKQSARTPRLLPLAARWSLVRGRLCRFLDSRRVPDGRHRSYAASR